MIDQGLLQILCCPETYQDLVLADESLIRKLNDAISQRKLKNRSGKLVEQTMDSGLVRQDRKYLYPVREDIPIMLVDESIPLE